MAVDFPYLRRMKVRFTGLADGREKTYISTGEKNTPRIIAKIRKSFQGLPSASEISIYNLSEDTRSAFRRNESKVRIEAGWDNGPRAGLAQSYYGDVFAADSNRSGPDIVTTIYTVTFIDPMFSATLEQTFKQGVSVAHVVGRLALSFKNIAIDSKKIVGLDRMRISHGGWCQTGSVMNGLNKLADAFGFTWNIIDGYFQACRDDLALGYSAVIEDPYLGNISPIRSGPGQWATGVSWNCLFNTAITPGYMTRINSVVSPRYNREYRVNTVEHNLDCFSRSSFTTNAIAYVPPGTEIN